MKTRAQSKRQSRRSSSRSLPASGGRRASRGRTNQPRSRRSRARISAAKAERTRDHEEIRQWAEARGGHPAMVQASRSGGKNPAGILRIDFPGFTGAGSLQEVSWEEWFDVFDDRNLEFLYQEKTAGGKPSRFNKLVCPA